MLIEIKLAETYILGFKLKKELERKEMKNAFGNILRTLECSEHFNIYLEIENFENFEFNSFIKGLKSSTNPLKKHIPKMDRIAIISNHISLSIFVPNDYKLTPEVELKSFKKNENNEARTWLNNAIVI